MLAKNDRVKMNNKALAKIDPFFRGDLRQRRGVLIEIEAGVATVLWDGYTKTTRHPADKLAEATD